MAQHHRAAVRGLPGAPGGVATGSAVERGSGTRPRPSRAPVAAPVLGAHVTGTTRSRGARRAQVLLEATNRFLSASDVDELGATIITVAGAILEPDKAVLSLVGPDGTSRVVGSVGFSPEELCRIDEAVRTGTPLHRRAVAGEELWSDDDGDDALRTRVHAYAGQSGFSVPVITTHGVAGSLGVVYVEDRGFDPGFREAARGLCSQAGLALELIAARDGLRHNAQALERQTRLARALFSVSQELARVTEPDDVPGALARAIRSASGASYSLVAQWDPTAGRLVFRAAEGLRPEHAAALRELDATPDRFRMIRGGLEGRANVRVPPFDPGDLPVPLIEALGLTAIAGAPIMLGDAPWGLIAVGATEPEPELAATGAELLAGLASIASAAIGRAQAAAELAHQASILESAIAERTIQLREAVDELRLASQAKTELLTNVSHELRTPLTAIVGFSEVLLEGLDGPLTAEQAEDVRTIDRSGRHLLELIDDLIDVSRIEAGRVELRPEPLDLGALVASAVREVGPLATQKGLSVRLDGPDRRLTIRADVSRVHEILLNLLSNAVKFTPSGGRIEVTTRAIDDGASVEVADTGIGIDPVHHALVFEKFQRLAGPEYGGTGLGLAIAREFARLHGGDLVLQSGVGAGSRFTLRLPSAPPGPHPAAPLGPSRDDEASDDRR